MRRLLPYGDRAVLVECADTDEMRALHGWLTAGSSPDSGTVSPAGQRGITELIPGARTLLVRLSRPLDQRFAHELSELDLPDAPVADDTLVTIEVDYDGEDLAEVAGQLSCSVAAVVDRHTGQTWTVAFCGFAPGFAYLAPEHPGLLRVARRAEPRTRVPPGSVGLADEYSGVYPRPGPGGWQLIGRTRRPMWDLDQDPPALLQPGMRVRFEPLR